MTRYLTILLCIFLSACANVPSLKERIGIADRFAQQRGWVAETLSAGDFKLLAYLPEVRVKTTTLTIYIEGDGFAWLSETQPSSDPTPINPMVLQLAISQPEDVAVYLARPCQYINAEASRCSRSYWTGQRFAPEVIAATNVAVEILKQRFGARQVVLVGYSGGGAVATLVAARRTDVDRLITISGNLDHQAWTTYHRIAPLNGSLNPADETQTLQGIQQWHFVGEKDVNITPAMAQGFVRRFSRGLKPHIEIEPGFDHRCCWAEKWPILWRKATGRE